VPLGALLSGGIDSSIVVAVMAQETTEPVRTFSIGFGDQRYDERRYARAVAERYGTVHEELLVEPDAAALIPRLAEAYDEPFGDTSALPTFLVCEHARSRVTVALVGDGGDEIFGGYERYRAHALADRLARVPTAVTAGAARVIRLIPAARTTSRSTVFRVARFLDTIGLDPTERYAHLIRLTPAEIRDGLWSPEAHAALGGGATRAATLLGPPRARGMSGLQLLDVATYLPDDLLYKADIASMAHSLEPRPAPRPRRRRAGARPPGAPALRREDGQGRAAAGVRRRSPARDRDTRQVRFRRSDRRMVPRGPPRPRTGRPPRLPRPLPRVVRATRARAAARRACDGEDRPRRADLGADDARALARALRRRPRVSRRAALLVVALGAALPRLLVVAIERDQLVSGLTEKSDRFARTFVESGTFGFIPGRPSAYTQPLYAFFLVPLYRAFGHAWWPAPLAQVAVATVTALLVYAVATSVVSRKVAVAAALIATLNPYLVWHDVHLNREVLDGLLAAALTLLVVRTVERASVRVAALGGVAAGLAILGNARLTLLPLVLAGYFLWAIAPRRTGLLAGGALIAATALTLTPWLVRNEVTIGCVTITTDARALWKANNSATFEILRHGGWIDQVPELRGAPPWPELAADLTRSGKPTTVDECAQQSYYEDKVLHFWWTQPGEKAKLATQAVWMLWRPTVSAEPGDGGSGRLSELARSVVQPAYILALYGFAIAGFGMLSRRYQALTILLVAYGTFMAMIFAGTMRYSAPWDFLLAIPAACGVARVCCAIARRRSAELPA
jgi:4-amino-4-deoxy-L-arabinose transferase-like glycosyltransferase